MDDVLIIGGSFAGLVAASHLARARRSVTILDTELPRNRFAEGAHNVLGFDGASPIAIRDKARADVLAYPTVRHVVAEATGIGGVKDDFVVRTLDGGTHVARRVLLSYGVVDQLPPIPGFAEAWGRSVFHCPYCHGYEVAGGRIGILYSMPGALHGTILLRDWTDNLSLLTNGIPLTDAERAATEGRGVKIHEGRVVEIITEAGQVRGVRFDHGGTVELDAILANPPYRPSARLHEDIGVAIEDSPMGATVRVNADDGQTSIAGVFAAGDLASARQSVNGAVHSGMIAGVGIHRSLLDWS